MSIQSVMSRAAALEAWIAGTAPAAQPAAAPAGATPGTAGVDFAGALAAARAGAPAGATASATPAPATGGAQVPFSSEIEAAAARNGIDPALLKGLIRQESNFDASAVSPAGARGLTQLMPGTAASVGVTDASDPLQAIEGGAKYLRQMLDQFGGDVERALAGYNAGPGAVARYGGVPPYPETQKYVRAVQEFAAGYRTAPSLNTLGSTIL